MISPELRGLDLVPQSKDRLTRKDFTSNQEVRWCPGCGDHAILATFQSIMPDLGIKRENTVVISGIGCSSRFPYYVNSYGMHSIHGRAPAIASGVAITRPDLGVWVITGDGDALSIGGNHLIHVLRRNINLNIIIFNNRIYGLTKGQYSPTSEMGKITKSTPLGSLDNPFNPVSLALGAEATFVARSIDSNRSHLSEILKSAAKHRGTSLVEIFQNCTIFNDQAFDSLKGSGSGNAIISLEHGKPVVFGEDHEKGVVYDQKGHMKIVDVADVGIDAIYVHDETLEDPSAAFALSRLTDAGVINKAPIGIFRNVNHPTYDDLARKQVNSVLANDQDATLNTLFAGKDSWKMP